MHTTGEESEDDLILPRDTAAKTGRFEEFVLYDEHAHRPFSGRQTGPERPAVDVSGSCWGGGVYKR
jgi:hypothetical protein